MGVRSFFQQAVPERGVDGVEDVGELLGGMKQELTGLVEEEISLPPHPFVYGSAFR